MQIPRKAAGYEGVDLHAFCDASTTAYDVAIYVVTSFGTTLLTASAKVAPVKKISLQNGIDCNAASRTFGRTCMLRIEYDNELTIRSVPIWCTELDTQQEVIASLHAQQGR